MIRSIVALAYMAAVAGPAFAASQTQPTPASPLTVSPGETHNKADSELGKKGNNQALSDRLSQSGGVIHPAPVDPGMQKAPTQQGTMPVLPPPGTPGGNLKVVPK